MDNLPNGAQRTAYEYNHFDSSYSLDSNATSIPTAVPAAKQQLSPLAPINTTATNPSTNPTGYPNPQLPIISTISLQDYRRNSYNNDQSQPTSGHSATSSPMYSPPGLSVSTSVSAVSDVVSPPITTLPSPVRRGSNDAAYTSPLDGATEWSHIAIPPLYPPAVQWPDHDFEDWDSLPELLRQEPRADFTPRRPMNGECLFFSSDNLGARNPMPLSRHGPRKRKNLTDNKPTSSTCASVVPSLPTPTHT